MPTHREGSRIPRPTFWVTARHISHHELYRRPRVQKPKQREKSYTNIFIRIQAGRAETLNLNRKRACTRRNIFISWNRHAPSCTRQDDKIHPRAGFQSKMVIRVPAKEQSSWPSSVPLAALEGNMDLPRPCYLTKRSRVFLLRIVCSGGVLYGSV